MSAAVFHAVREIRKYGDRVGLADELWCTLSICAPMSYAYCESLLVVLGSTVVCTTVSTDCRTSPRMCCRLMLHFTLHTFRRLTRCNPAVCNPLDRTKLLQTNGIASVTGSRTEPCLRLCGLLLDRVLPPSCSCGCRGSSRTASVGGTAYRLIGAFDSRGYVRHGAHQYVSLRFVELPPEHLSDRQCLA